MLARYGHKQINRTVTEGKQLWESLQGSLLLQDHSDFFSFNYVFIYLLTITIPYKQDAKALNVPCLAINTNKNEGIIRSNVDLQNNTFKTFRQVRNRDRKNRYNVDSHTTSSTHPVNSK